MKTKIKSMLLLSIIVLVFAVGCDCNDDTDCYEANGGVQHDSSKTYYIEFETE